MSPLLPGSVQATAISSSFCAFLHAMEEKQIMLLRKRVQWDLPNNCKAFKWNRGELQNIKLGLISTGHPRCRTFCPQVFTVVNCERKSLELDLWKKNSASIARPQASSHLTIIFALNKFGQTRSSLEKQKKGKTRLVTLFKGVTPESFLSKDKKKKRGEKQTKEWA